MLKLVMLIAAVPVFVRVTGFGPPALPIATLYQLKLVGETVPAARQFTPVRRIAENKQETKQEIRVFSLIGEALKLYVQTEKFW